MTAEVLRYAAFTDGGRGGNPAGVVLDAGSLTDAQMLAIAKAIGYSETAFVLPASDLAADDGVRRLRFFSPVAEVAFCGHATVATAIAIAEREGAGELRFETMAGSVGVRTRIAAVVTATLTSPPASARPITDVTRDEALHALRWSPSVLDHRFPAHVAFAGNHHLVLGVTSRKTLASLDYDYPQLAALMEREAWTTVHLFWAENATTFHARNPFPPGGVVEDPATGAAAAAFGGYLRDLRLAPATGRVTILQGFDMGSPSRLEVEVSERDPRVQVTGSANRLALSPYDELELL